MATHPCLRTLAVAAIALLAACKGEGTEPTALDQVLIDRGVDSVLFVGESVDLRAVAVDAERRELLDLSQRIAWSSDDDDVVTVDSSTGVVVASGPGTTNVRARVQGKTAAISFSVSYAVATVEVVLADGDSVRVRDDLRACAVVRSSDGVEIADGEVAWAVSDDDVLSFLPTVARCVTLTGERKGLAIVSAEIGGKRGESTVRVVNRVAALSVATLPGTLVAGECVSLGATPADAEGAPLTRPVTYSTSEPRVATVNQGTGVACWEAAGSAALTVESEGVRKSVEVTVRPAPLTVVGYADLESDARRGFKWTEAGGLEQLPVLPTAVSAVAKGVNDNGQIVGESRLPDGQFHAFLYTAGRGVRELPFPPGAVGAEAKAINNSGQVGGSAFFPDGSQHVVIWSVAGDEITVFDRGVAPGAVRSNVEAINGTGIIAGNAFDAQGRTRAFRMSPNGNYGYLDAAPSERSSDAKGINYLGDIAGFYTDSSDVRRPFLTHQGSDKRVLPLPAACEDAVAYGIDNEGRSVVTATGCPGGDRTFLRGINGTYTQLFGPNTQSRAMNERGDVVGWTLVNGKNQAYLWRRGAATGTLLGRFGDGQRSNALALNAPQ